MQYGYDFGLVIGFHYAGNSAEAWCHEWQPEANDKQIGFPFGNRSAYIDPVEWVAAVELTRDCQIGRCWLGTVLSLAWKQEAWVLKCECDYIHFMSFVLELMRQSFIKGSYTSTIWVSRSEYCDFHFFEKIKKIKKL